MAKTRSTRDAKNREHAERRRVACRTRRRFDRTRDGRAGRRTISARRIQRRPTLDSGVGSRVCGRISDRCCSPNGAADPRTGVDHDHTGATRRAGAGGSRRASFYRDPAESALGLRLHHLATWRGFVYVAFLIDVFARRIVGWRASASPRTGSRLGRARASHLRPVQHRHG